MLPQDHFEDVQFYASSREIKKDEEILINYAEGGDDEKMKNVEKMHGIVDE